MHTGGLISGPEEGIHRPGLHLRPVNTDHAWPPLQWTLNSVFSAYGNDNRTHHPKFLKTYKGRVNTITITPSFTCYVFKQLIIKKSAGAFQPVNR